MDGFTYHGGRLDAAMRAWPSAPMPWIDISTGVNPAPYPAPRATKASRSRLPFPAEIEALELAAATTFGVTDPDRVAAIPGAELGLRLLPKLLDGARVAIAEPTYASHGLAWSNAGARLLASQDEAEVVVVVNPNNPDGKLVEQTTLLAMAQRLAAREGWLVVDESFADGLPGPSIAAAGHPRIVTLRSFGKFYGLAGLRLGFLIGEPALMRKVRALLGAWPVSADAIAAGLAAYADAGWRDRTRARLSSGAAKLDAILMQSGFELVGGTSLFRLVKAEDAPRRFAELGAGGVLCRPFAAERTWLRFGLPAKAMWPRVDAALRASA
jgi:cobalamin biosynthetic protein CobC